MSLRILFADDSVTAQNMGKKILTEAGYDVVAVSNGAAAVKKIAEQKPDIIILDLYMPGYSGLEVCEKVRASIATIKTPVLLTVGKMEPYKPEDANRVRADGVIIKPFEASDLLAIVKKFEERIGQMQAAAPPPPPPPTEQIDVAPEPHYEHPEPPPTPMQPMVEVPDHMATSSAFSDLLGSDTHNMDHYNVATPQRVPEPKPASSTVMAAAVPGYDIPVSWQAQPEAEPAPVPEAVAVVAEAAPPVEPGPEIASTPAPVEVAAPQPMAAPAPGPQAIPVPQETPAPPRTRLIPIFQESAVQPHDFIPTAASPIGDIDIAREPQLQETAEETTRNTIADAREPGLMPTLHQPQEQLEADPELAEFTPEPEPPAPGVVQAAPELAPPSPLRPMAEPVKAATEMDFESRVAAAMAAYSPAPEAPPASPLADPAPPATRVAAAVAPAPIQVPQRSAEPAIPETGHHEIATAQKELAPAETPKPEEPEVRHEDIVAKIEKELPAATVAAAAEAGAEHHETITQAVHRVMERVKGDLVDEILRELKSKK